MQFELHSKLALPIRGLALVLVIGVATTSVALALETSDRVTILEEYHGYFPCSDCHEDQETIATPRFLIDEHYEPLEWEDDDGNTYLVEFGELVSFAELLGATEGQDRRGENLARIGRQLQVAEYMEENGYAPEDSVWTLMHGGANLWCLDCHNADNRDYLRKLNGELLDFNQSHVLCGQCHGPILADWDIGLHGRTSGYWNLELDSDDVSVRLLCVECHIPHAPRFRSQQPMAGPVPRRAGPPPEHVHHETHRGERDELGPHPWDDTDRAETSPRGLDSQHEHEPQHGEGSHHE